MDGKTIILPIDLANLIIGYLGTRPYQEVYQLIQAMQDAAKPALQDAIKAQEAA